MNKILTTLSILTLTTAFIPSTHAADEAFSAAQTTEIENILAEYIKDNPQAILDSIENYRLAEMEKAAQEAKEKAATLSKDFKTDDTYPMAGNKDGDIVVAEFFDYNCGYCKKAFDGLQQLLKNDDQVKIVFIELPILGDSSLLAAKWSLASQEQDKYFEYHQAIMDHRGQKTESELKKLAESVGLDVKKLEKDMNSSKIQKQLDANKELAASLGISGTPALIIEDEVIRGYIPYESMAQMIDGLRDQQKK